MMDTHENREIEVLLRGGFGNQLFQYYAAEKIAESFGTDFILNLSGLGRENPPPSSLSRSFQLFNLKNLPKRELSIKKGVRFKSDIAEKIPSLSGLLGIINDLNQSNYQARKKLILNGYFQSSDYIWLSRERIAFEVSNDLHSMNALAIRKEILLCPESIGIHLRLGDYLNLPDFKIASKAYISTSLMKIRSTTGNLPIFLITDSEDLAVKMYSDLFSEYSIKVLQTNQIPSWEIIQILKLFKFLVLSKSSLSWWGGFLSLIAGNNIIAPHVPNQVSIGNFSRNQLLPGWQTVEN